jgi:hypothetical protein
MPTRPTTPVTPPKLQLNADESATIAQGFNTIQKVLKSKNINIQHVIGLVTAPEVQSAAQQVQIKFAEETAAQMNMIAFD